MGILNLTPDSFSGDGVIGGTDAAVRRAEALVAAGADILDVGGESTRPGHETVPEDVELARVLPTLERLAGHLPVPISIDTRKSRVAEAALAAGATIVNDVSGLTYDPRLAAVASQGRRQPDRRALADAPARRPRGAGRSRSSGLQAASPRASEPRRRPVSRERA